MGRSQAERDDMASRLEHHYARHGRKLPWRDGASAYGVAVSEFMLQQTTVETVVAYFRRFLAAFPDFATLAAASEVDVLRHWEGLGYYRRARSLHRLAKAVVASGGSLPDSEEALRGLPGVGPYTAAAIRLFGQRRRALPVDANVRRVTSRLFALEGASDDLVRERLDAIAPADPYDFFQALMDLGASLCRARSPQCGACPLATDCAACASGHPEAFGRSPARGAVRDVDVVLVAVRRGGEVLVRRREEGLLGGLWGLPEAFGESRPAGLECASVADTGLSFTHRFTHRRWHVRIQIADGAGEGKWVSARDPGLPLGGPDRTALRLLLEGGFLDGDR